MGGALSVLGADHFSCLFLPILCMDGEAIQAPIPWSNCLAFARQPQSAAATSTKEPESADALFIGIGVVNEQRTNRAEEL
jgi:hypothetical protein